jgi:hypothetical protein
LIEKICLCKVAALLALIAVLAAACGDGGSPNGTPEGGSPSGTQDGPLAVPTASSGGGRVLYVAPDGDDAADGSAERPWRTIQHAADSVQPGDTVMVGEGTYHEEVTLTRSGETNRAVGFRAKAARNAGDPEQGGTPDMEGNRRPFDGVDIGPYEAQ